MKRNSLVIAGIVVLTGVLYFVALHAVPYHADDLWYAMRQVAQGMPEHRVAGWDDIVASQVCDYNTSNSRVIVNGIVQAVVSFAPKAVFDVVGTLVFLITLFLVVRLAAPRQWRSEPAVWLAAIAMLYVLLPCHYEALLWATGSISYLWTGCGMLLLLALWRYAASHRLSPWWCLLLVPVGVVAGWSHEGYSTGIATGCILSLLLHRRHLRAAHVALTAGMAVGVACLLMAPCMSLRLQGNANGYGLGLYPVESASLLLPALLFVTLAVLWGMKHPLARRCMSLHIIPLVGIVIATAIAIATGASRAYVCGAFLSILPLTYLFAEGVVPHMGKYKRAVNVVAGTCLLVFAVSLQVEHSRVEQRHRAFLEQCSRGNGTVIAQYYTPRAFARGYTLDMQQHYDEAWVRTHLAGYYGLPRVNVIPATLYEALQDTAAFFAPAHRVAGTAPMYTQPHIAYYVWQPGAPLARQLYYRYAPVSMADPVSLPGRVRRALSPAHYPHEERVPAVYNSFTLPTGETYYYLYKNAYRTVLQIDTINDESL